MKSRSSLFCTLSCACLLVLASRGFGSDYYVDKTSGLDNPGRGTRENPWATINYALDHINGTAGSPHRVLVAGGIYIENVVCDPYESIYGGYDPTTWARDSVLFETTINGSQVSSAVVLADRSTVDGFTLTNGQRDLGGGVYCSNVISTVSNCRISLNEATANDGGSAIYVSGGLVYITGNTIVQNKNSAIRIDSGTAVFQANTIADTASPGGFHGTGIYAEDATLSLLGDRIVRNARHGMYARSSVVEASDCVIGDNGKSGIAVFRTDVTLRQCVVSGNTDSGLETLNTDNTVAAERCVFCQNGSEWTGAINAGEVTQLIDSIFVANGESLLRSGDKSLRNNFFVNNKGLKFKLAIGGVVVVSCSNNTILYNNGGYNFDLWEGWHDGCVTMSNDLLWGNGDDLILSNENQSISFCNIENGDFNGKNGNISVAPDFVGEVASGVIGELVYGADRCRSNITDYAAHFPIGELARCFLWVNDTAFYIEFNTESEITVYGDVGQAASEGATFTIQDYRLQNGSLCIDAGTGSGAPEHDFEGDPRPMNGGKGMLVDIGADEFNPAGSPNDPPTQPTIVGTLAIAVTLPSVDPDGGPVTYTVEWESDTGDVVVHRGCSSIRGTLCDVLTETDLLKPSQTWIVTVTPSDISQTGVPVVVELSLANSGDTILNSR